MVANEAPQTRSGEAHDRARPAAPWRIALACALGTCLAGARCNEGEYYSFLSGGAVPRPELAVEPDALVINAVEGDSTPADGVIEISNAGIRTLVWSASVDSGGAWLSIDAASGSITNASAGSPGAPDLLTATADIAGLDPAESPHEGTVLITASDADGSPRTVSVALWLNVSGAPAVELSQSTWASWAYLGGGAPEDVGLTVRNSAGGRLDWTASSDAAWVTVAPGSGTSTGEFDGLAVSIDPASIRDTPGEHVATVTVGDGVVPDATFTATYTVYERPQIAASEAGLSFEGLEQDALNPAPGTLDVWNAGGRTLNWSASSSAAWLGVSPATGDSDGISDVDTVSVSVDLTGLARGVYHANITLRDPDASPASLAVPVTLAVSQWGDTFDDGDANDGAAGAPGSRVDWDETAGPGGSWTAALGAYSGAAGPGVPSMSLAGNVAWDDYALGLDVGPGAPFAGVSVLLRVSADGLSYYEFAADGTDMVLSRVVGGSGTQLATAAFTLAGATSLRLEISGRRMRVANGSTMVLDYTDGNPAALTSGRIGLLVPAGSEGLFDSVLVEQLTGPLTDPDVTITTLAVSDALPTVGGQIEVTVTVANRGNAAANNVRVDLVLDSDVVPPVGTTGARYQIVATLAPGAQQSVAFAGVTSGVPDRWHVYAIADTLDTIHESNEANNVCGPEEVAWAYLGSDDYEPDDNPADATDMDVGESQTRSIYPVGDQDYVRFTLTTAATVRISLSTYDYYYYYMYLRLYDANMVQIAWDYGRSINMIVPLPAGVYYVRTYYNGSSTVPMYNISLFVY